MVIQKAAMLCSLSFSFICSGYQEPLDPIAFRAGELVGELTFQSWIEAAKKNRSGVIELAKKIAQTGYDYSVSYNRSFLEGYQSCLVEKDVGMQLEYAQLDRFGCALVLASYYYWTYQLLYALETHNYAFLPNESIEDQALEKATMLAYGFPYPEIIKKLKWMLKEDYLDLAEHECTMSNV